jgi:hypothetical protein
MTAGALLVLLRHLVVDTIAARHADHGCGCWAVGRGDGEIPRVLTADRVARAADRAVRARQVQTS